MHSATALEEAAARLSLDDYTSINTLAERVIDYPHLVRLSDDSKSFLKGALPLAEHHHLSGSISGIHEHALASTLNDVCDSLKVPTFARVTPSQLRVLRVRLLQTHPTFMGRGITMATAHVGDSINPKMSPLQAMHLSLVMSDQKIMNVSFQCEVDEWERLHSAQHFDPWQRVSNDTASSPAESLSINRTGRALLRTIYSNASQMASSDQLALATNAMQQLGL
jgi:hypothetical protein